MLAHTARRPKSRSSLRLREPRRLPTALSQPEAAELLASFRTWRDRAIAGLMLYCGLRSAEVLALDVADVDIGGRWLAVIGKGRRERRVPLDVDVASVDPGLSAGRAARSRTAAGCSWWPRAPPGTAAVRGRAAHDLPLPPRADRDRRWASRTRCGTPSAPPWPRPESISP